MLIRSPTFWIGVAADTLTFVGAVLLAIDARQRLADVQAIKTQQTFERLLPGVSLSPEDEAQAARSVRRSVLGIRLIAVGFLLQLILRFLV